MRGRGGGREDMYIREREGIEGFCQTSRIGEVYEREKEGAAYGLGGVPVKMDTV